MGYALPFGARSRVGLAAFAIAACAPTTLAQEPDAVGDEAADVTIEPAPDATVELEPTLEEQLPFQFSITGTTTYQSTLGAQRDTDYIVGYLDAVIERELWKGTTAYVEFESLGGNGPDENVPSFSGVYYGWNANGGSAQDPDGYDRVYLAEVALSTDALGYDWVLDFGKLASTSYLDTVRVANDSTTQFLSGSFSQSTAFQVPWRGPGIALTYVGNEHFDVRLLVLRPDNGGASATSHVFAGAQAGYFWGSEGHAGNCNAYIWNNAALDDQSGAGITVDQDLSERVTAFGRIARQEEESSVPQAIESAWSLGFELRQGFTGKESDGFGLALGLNRSHDDTLDDESVYETYYSRVFNEHFSGSLHVQGMNHPGGDPNEDFVTALGLRLVFSM